MGSTGKEIQRKIRKVEEDRWVYECREEKKRVGLTDSYSQAREKYYNRNGWGLIAVDNMPEEERDIKAELAERDRAVQRQEDSGKIDKARYNNRYKKIVKEDRMPEYLKRMSISKTTDGEGIRAPG